MPDPVEKPIFQIVIERIIGRIATAKDSDRIQAIRYIQEASASAQVPQIQADLCAKLTKLLFPELTT